MDCPHCTLPLRKIDLGRYKGEYASVVVDICPECQGTWLDKGELDLRDESVWTDAEAVVFQSGQPNHSPLICPRCAVPLSSSHPKGHPDLILDRCPDCSGFWLDQGELEKIQDMAADLDSAKMKSMTRLQRPPGWSWLRWAVFCVIEHYRRDR